MLNWQKSLAYFNTQPLTYSRICSIDCESTGVHLHHSSMPFMVCASFSDGECLTWEGEVDPLTRQVYWSKEQQQELAELVNHSDWLYVLTNKKFDTRCLSKIIPDFDPYEFLNRCHDTLPMHHVFNNRESHSLKDAAVKYAGIPDKDEKVLLQAVRDAKQLAVQLGLPWAFASKTTCPQQTKAPHGDSTGGKGWAVMDYWLPKTLIKWQWENSECYKLFTKLTISGSELSLPVLWEFMSQTERLAIKAQPGWHLSPPEINPDAHSWWTVCQEYCAYDTLRTLLLFNGFKESLEREYTYEPLTGVRRPLWEVYLENLPAFSISYITEEAGLTFFADQCLAEITRLEFVKQDAEEAVSLALNKYTKFNPGSSQQISSVIYGIFKIPVTRRTKPSKKKDSSWGAGNPTTDEDFITELLRIFSPEDPGLYRPPEYQRGVESYKDYRVRLLAWHKLVTTSGEPIQLFAFCAALLMWKKTSSTITKLKGYVHAGIANRLHPSLNPIGAKTPRYSSSNPNGQNISKGGKGKIPASLISLYPQLRNPLRRFFGPLPGREWWSIDYTQLQLVIAATMFNSTKMLEQLAAGRDFHDAMARIIFSVPDATLVTDEQRSITKNCNFGYWFGAGADKIDLTCGIPGMYDKLASLFPEVPEALDRMSWQVRRNGFVTTLGGYRLLVPEDSPYAGCVYAVQGTEGVLVKRATYCIQHWLETSSSCFLGSSRSAPVSSRMAERALEGRTSQNSLSGRRTSEDIHFNLFLHDELDFDCVSGRGHAYIPTIVNIMEEAALSFGVPAKAVAKYHPLNWGQSAKEEQVD